MSIVAMSETFGSLGSEIGRAAATALRYEFADREIITRAAERHGEAASDLWRVAEQKPTLRERLTERQHHSSLSIEATLFEMASRDNVVLIGRASTVVLREAPHTLRVRVDAPESCRVQRVQQRLELPRAAAKSLVQRSDHERAARVKFLYRVDWDDARLYDLVLNTERLGVHRAARLVVEALQDPRFRSTDASRTRVADMSLLAQARATLSANAITRAQPIQITASDGKITLRATVDSAHVWAAAVEAVSRLSSVREVQDEITVEGHVPEELKEAEELSHGQFRHGEGRSWGGYGGDWYDREWQALRQYRARRGHTSASAASKTAWR